MSARNSLNLRRWYVLGTNHHWAQQASVIHLIHRCFLLRSPWNHYWQVLSGTLFADVFLSTVFNAAVIFCEALLFVILFCFYPTINQILKLVCRNTFVWHVCLGLKINRVMLFCKLFIWWPWYINYFCAYVFYVCGLDVELGLVWVLCDRMFHQTLRRQLMARSSNFSPKQQKFSQRQWSYWQKEQNFSPRQQNFFLESQQNYNPKQWNFC